MSDNVTGVLDSPGAARQPSTLELYASAPVLSCFSPAFYFHAARRRVLSAIGFFLLFTVLIAVLQAVSLGIEMAPARAEIEQAFQSGRIPTITISHGVATVEGRQPFVLVNGPRQLVVLDTTGRYGPADLMGPTRYETAVLLTKTELVALNRGQLRVVRLADLQSTLGEPFELNAGVIQWWLSAFQAIALAALVIWNPLFGLVYVALIGLLVWAITSAIQRGVGFGPVFIAGLYAFVPATYLEYMLKRGSVEFCGLGTLLFVAIWVAFVAVILWRIKAGTLREDTPLAAWRALIGVPMLFILFLNVIFTRPVGVIIMWSVAALTVLAFIAVALLAPDKPTTVAAPDAGSS